MPSRRPRRFSIPRGLVLPGFVALVLIPGLLIGAMFEIHRELARSRELRAAVNHSYEERLQLQAVFSLMQDAETGQRGYVITGQERFLEPYHHALGRLSEERARLRVLQQSEVGSPERLQSEELKNLARLEALIDAKLANMRMTIDARRHGGEARGQAVVSTGEGKRIMDAIRLETSRMAADEAAALDARVREDALRTRSTGIAVLVTFGVMGAALLATFVLILRQWHLRQGLMKKMEANAARNQAIFESASDGLITFNRSGTIESINKAAEIMSGFTREELARRDVGVLLALPDNEKVFVDRLDEAGAGVGATREYQARRKDGSHFPVEVSLGRFEHGGEALLVASIRDITERRRVEKLKSEFVSTVSHELRTPLTSIAGSLGLLVGGAAGPLPEKAARLLGIAHSNCQRLVRLINDILDIEKIESGQLSFTMSPLKLEDVARKSLDGMSGLAAELGVRLELQAAPDLPPIRGDADRLAQVAANLISNAAKFSPAGETVRIEITRAEGRVRLSVADRGPGVPEAFRDRIFSKFAQADGSDSRAKGGTGLGLAISKEIVERHGGRLWFESAPGQGAVFHADFPPLARAEATPSRGPRVLVCEDDPDAATVLGEVLRREGFAPVFAGSVAEAQAALDEKGAFAAVLLDLRLPDGNGLDLLRRLREQASTRTVPVLIVSGDADQCRFQPFDLVEWLQKPVDTSRLRAAIRRAVPDPGAERPLVLHLEDDADVRAIVADALASICDIVAAESLAAAQQLLRTIRPQLAILDVALGDGSGLQLIPKLNPPGQDSIPIIVFSAQSLDDEALAASVDAVLTKSCTTLDELGATVHRLAAAREGQD